MNWFHIRLLSRTGSAPKTLRQLGVDAIRIAGPLVGRDVLASAI